MAVFNDPPPGKHPRIKLQYGTADKARASIRRLKKQPLSYQTQVAHTMYYRAKYHKHQTDGMKEAARIYGRFLKTLKAQTQKRSKKSKANAHRTW